MTHIHQYQCDLCKQRYYSEEEAVECEAKGKFDGAKFWPKGLMFAYYSPYFLGIFALPEVPSIRKESLRLVDEHYGYSSWWACRIPTLGGDSLGEEKCSGPGSSYIQSNQKYFYNWARYYHIPDNKIGCPEFNRMVGYLRSQGIQPSYYNSKFELVKLGIDEGDYTVRY